MSAMVLVVDDVRPLAEQYAFDLERLGGFRTRIASGGVEGLEILSKEVVDCVILDLEMPDKDGFEVLRAMDHHGIGVPVIVYTGTGSYDRCAEAVRLGAFSFIDKADSMERVVQEVRLALRQASLRDQVQRLEERVGADSPLIGGSEAMGRLRDSIERLAAVPSPVLVLGESGTGKELVARELHGRSPRHDGPFVAVNCGGMAEGLMESDLFGHEKGAFTGAIRARKGAFERASGGTLFLDEVGELPVTSQSRLLRVLEQGEVTRLGAEEVTGVDCRIVAATHRSLEQGVSGGSFREDLLYRLNVHVITVPPLRDRLDDVPLLVAHFVETLSPRLGRRPRPVTSDAAGALASRSWRRNNVRELRNTVERMIIASDDPVLDLAHVPPDLEGSGNGGSEGGSSGIDDGPTFREQKTRAEREILVRALEAHDWKITQAAASLGLADHASLLKIMRKHGIRRP